MILECPAYLYIERESNGKRIQDLLPVINLSFISDSFSLGSFSNSFFFFFLENIKQAFKLSNG